MFGPFYALSLPWPFGWEALALVCDAIEAQGFSAALRALSDFLGSLVVDDYEVHHEVLVELDPIAGFVQVASVVGHLIAMASRLAIECPRKYCVGRDRRVVEVLDHFLPIHLSSPV